MINPYRTAEPRIEEKVVKRHPFFARWWDASSQTRVQVFSVVGMTLFYLGLAALAGILLHACRS